MNRALDGRLWLLAVVVRVVAIFVLMAGPWTDEPAELAGWDAERFQAIADRDGAAWVDLPVEYPPGSVLLFDLVAGDDVVSTNRTLIVVSVVAEIAAVIALWRRFGPRTGKAFLLVGGPLVPMGYLRLDMVVTALGVGAATALLRRDKTAGPVGRSWSAGRSRSDLVFAGLAAAGALIKIWPALLVAGAMAIDRFRAAVGCVGLMAIMGFGWLGLTGAGLEPLDQVLSLRGATGWHIESLPGSLVSLLGDEQPRLELNAFRVGTLNRSLVTAGRLLAVGVMLALVVAGRRHRRTTGPDRAGEPDRPDPGIDIDIDIDIETVSLVMLGSVAVLLVTAPLLSPQFLLWLTPWIALDIGQTKPIRRSRSAIAVPAIGVLAITLTGLALIIYGPSNLAEIVPAGILLTRNLLLLAVPPMVLGLLMSGRERTASLGH